jgi:hypothetical protein
MLRYVVFPTSSIGELDAPWAVAIVPHLRVLSGDA